MEHDQNLVEHPPGDGLGFRVKRSLDQLDVPIAERVPDEVVDRVRRRIKAQVGHRLVEFGEGFDHFADDPPVDRAAGRRRFQCLARANPITLAEPRRVPQLGGEVAIAFDAPLIHLHVAALAFHRRHEEAQRVGAILVDEAQRIDHVALGFGHLRPVGGAHEAVEIEPLPRVLARHRLSHHHHPRIPEEQDVEAGDEEVVGVVAGEELGLLRPAERGERPQRGGEPGVEDVLVAPNRIMPEGLVLAHRFEMSAESLTLAWIHSCRRSRPLSSQSQRFIFGFSDDCAIFAV